MTSFALLPVNIDPNAYTTPRVAVSQRERRALSSDAERPIRPRTAITPLAAQLRSTRTRFEQSTCLSNDKTP